MLDVTKPLGTLLDTMLVNAGGRKQRFHFLQWGTHQDQSVYSALAVASPSTTTVKDSILSVRPLTNPTRESNVGGGAQQNRQVLDVHVWWQGGADLTDPEVFRAAVVAAVKGIVRTNRRNCAPAYFITCINSIPVDTLRGDRSGTGSIFYEQVISVEARGVEVYA